MLDRPKSHVKLCSVFLKIIQKIFTFCTVFFKIIQKIFTLCTPRAFLHDSCMLAKFDSFLLDTFLCICDICINVNF